MNNAATYQNKTSPNRSLPDVSIVIPFHNEAHNLFRLLQSLAVQEYKGTYEIILVNDCSTDRFHDIVERFKRKNPWVSLVLLDTYRDTSVRLTNKQHALETGIKHAEHEWIVFTDADMYLEKNWLQSLMAQSENASFVYGRTTIEKRNNTFFEIFQAFQLDFLFAVAYTFHTIGFHGSCMGNNIAVKKDAYQRIGGQKSIGYTIIEDRALLSHFLKNGYTAAITIPFFATARTFPCESADQFFNQMLRWIRGGLFYSKTLLFPMLLFGIQNVVLLLSLFSVIPTPIVVLSLLNLGIMGIFLSIAFKKIGSRIHILFYPVFYLILIIETVVMIVPSVCMTPLWKGKRV